VSARADRVVRTEQQRCPRRDENPVNSAHFSHADWWERGRWASTQQEADAEVAEMIAESPNVSSVGNLTWGYGGEQPRTCSYCGGIHPDDAIALIKAGWSVDATDKGYKRYLEPPGYRAYAESFWKVRAGDMSEAHRPPRVESPTPPVKLYVQHFNAEQIAAFNVVLKERAS